MMEMTEIPLKQNAANFLGTEKEVHYNNNSATRKIEFDRGIPLSFDFASNQIRTFNSSVPVMIGSLLNRILLRPLHLFMIILIIIYVIASGLEGSEVSKMNISVTFYVHVFMIMVEILNELFRYYKIYRNDKKQTVKTLIFMT